MHTQPEGAKAYDNYKFITLARLLKKLNTKQCDDIPAHIIVTQVEQVLAGTGLRLDFDSEYDIYSIREAYDEQ